MTPDNRPASEGVAKRLLRLALPVMGLNLLSVISLAVDTAMCARLPNREVALNALGFATQVVFLAMVTMLGLVVGSVALVARAHGAGDDTRASYVLRQSTQLTFGVSVFVAVVGYFFAADFLRLLGARPDDLELALDYLRPNLSFCVFFYLTMLYAAVLRGMGDTKTAFMIGLVTNGLNVLFNYGLILGNYGLPALGVEGAAIGTVLSQAVGVLLYVIVLKRGTIKGLVLRLAPTTVDWDLAKLLAIIGAPAALDMLILNASFASIVGMLAPLDELAVAAHGVGIRVQSMAFVPGLGIAQATGAMVGAALGAGDPGEARAASRASMVLAASVMTALSLFLLFEAASVVALFDVPAGSRLSQLSVSWIQILGVGMPVMGVHIAIMGVLRGAGATKESLFVNVVGTIFQVPVSWLLGFPLGLGTLGVWAGFPLSFLFKAIIAGAIYRSGRWTKTGQINV